MQNQSSRRKSQAAVLLFLLFSAFAAPRSLWAQGENSLNGASKPDVQIVVMPVMGQWVVSTVYPQKVTRAEADTRLKRLLELTQWKATDTVFENRALGRAMNAGDVRREQGPEAVPITAPPAVMSSLTFQTTANVVDYADGTMVVEPFVRAFRDLNRVHVTFLVPGAFTFKGLRHYSGNDADILMASGGQGAYTYAMNIKNHRLDALNLPRYESISPVKLSDKTSGTNGTGRARIIGSGLIVLLALGAGAIVYVWAHRVSGR